MINPLLFSTVPQHRIVSSQEPQKQAAKHPLQQKMTQNYRLPWKRWQNMTENRQKVQKISNYTTNEKNYEKDKNST